MKTIHLKKDRVLIPNFVRQIICICQFMVLIVGVMVLKATSRTISQQILLP